MEAGPKSDCTFSKNMHCTGQELKREVCSFCAIISLMRPALMRRSMGSNMEVSNARGSLVGPDYWRNLEVRATLDMGAVGAFLPDQKSHWQEVAVQDFWHELMCTAIWSQF